MEFLLVLLYLHGYQSKDFVYIFYIILEGGSLEFIYSVTNYSLILSYKHFLLVSLMAYVIR